MTPAVVVTAAIFWTRSDGFTVSEAFTALSIVSLVATPLANLMGSYPQIISSIACFDRIEDFLISDEQRDARLVPNADHHDETNENPTAFDLGDRTEMEIPRTRDTGKEDSSRILLQINDITVIVRGREDPVMKALTLSIPAKSCTMIVGPVGCGKSTLLKVILGEIAPSQGTIHLARDGASAAYCDQTAWLRNISIRDNIVGEEDFDQEWYARVIHACALQRDIIRFPKGDNSLVGSGGITLSGGQKQRVVRTMLILLWDCLFR